MSAVHINRQFDENTLKQIGIVLIPILIRIAIETMPILVRSYLKFCTRWKMGGVEPGFF
jgi:hypothetical protein